MPAAQGDRARRRLGHRGPGRGRTAVRRHRRHHSRRRGLRAPVVAAGGDEDERDDYDGEPVTGTGQRTHRISDGVAYEVLSYVPTLHKRRNVTDHLPRDQRGWVDRKLAGAFNNPDPRHRAARRQGARQAAQGHAPDAAASLREGLDDMFTVRRLRLSERLCRTLTNTNTIGSMISVARSTTRNVKRWRDGKMIKRWVAAGMLNAERSFRRARGAKDMPTLLAALARHVDQINEEVHTGDTLTA